MMTSHYNRSSGPMAHPMSPLRVARPRHDENIGSALSEDGSISTIFSLISIPDPNGYPSRRMVTADSFNQFLKTMRVSIPDTVDDLIRTAVAASGSNLVSASSALNQLSPIPRLQYNSPAAGVYGRSSSDTPTAIASSSNGAPLALNEQQALGLLTAIPNTVSILLDRCDLLAELSEQPFENAKINEEISHKEQLLVAMEQDRRHLLQQAEAVEKKKEALVTSPCTAFGGDEPRPERYGSPSLRSAEIEQRQRLAQLAAAANKASDHIEELIQKHKSAMDVKTIREKEAVTAEDNYKDAERRLYDHTTAMIDIEQAFLAAKARFEEAQELQRQLSREQQKCQEVADAARALLGDAAQMEASLREEIEATNDDLHNNLKQELRDTQKIVSDLESAASLPNKRDRHLSALNEEQSKLNSEIRAMNERIDALKKDMGVLESDRSALGRIAAKHAQWLNGNVNDQYSKAFEDSVLIAEIRRLISRQQLEADERRYAEQRAQLNDLYGQRSTGLAGGY